MYVCPILLTSICIWIMYTMYTRLCHVGVNPVLWSINIHSTYSRVLQSPVTHQQVTMGTSYSSQQLGIFNMNISHLNMPSMFLGICLILSLWFCCKIRKGCRLFTRRHETQSEALKTISETVSQQPTIRAPIRGTAEPMFLNLWSTAYHYHFRHWWQTAITSS